MTTTTKKPQHLSNGNTWGKNKGKQIWSKHRPTTIEICLKLLQKNINDGIKLG
jgi:hypothetical protein